MPPVWDDVSALLKLKYLPFFVQLKEGHEFWNDLGVKKKKFVETS